uniref:Uncharacterized protein n=1 Tax=Quercus lobata TaxID=97700 RepID=A0A7N2LWJ2_QUELO
MSSKLSLLHRTTSQGMIRLDESETFWVKMLLAAPKLDLPPLQKKQKRPHKSILTLGYLRAFCSPACCDNQMSWDGFPKLESSEPTKLITGRKDMRSQGLGDLLEDLWQMRHELSC